MTGWERGKSLRDVETSAEEPQPAPPNPQTPGITTWNDTQDPFNWEETHEGVDEGVDTAW